MAEISASATSSLRLRYSASGVDSLTQRGRRCSFSIQSRFTAAPLEVSLLYASRRIDGQRALEIGLADRLVPDGTQRSEAIAWAAEIAERAPLAVQSMTQTLRAPLAGKVRAVLERELSEQARLWATEDSKIGIAANLARQKPVFTGR